MNDFISRQAAIDATWFEPSYTDPLNVLTEVRDRLKALPSAQPKCSESPNSSNTVNRIEAEKAICNACGKIDCDDMDTCKKLQLPSAQPDIIRCKDCKHWKDSDGVYRRGIGAESKCPLNLKKVYEGTFYCGMAERRTDG